MRKLTAMLVLLLYIAGYIALIASVGSFLTTWPRLVQLIFYIIAGFIWIIPLRPLFSWMNSGAQRDDD